jgi:anti-sigma regulatory factor (Ser/Thr protein kinase)
VQTAMIELAKTALAPRQARDWLATYASAWGIGDLLREDAALLITEVVTNAVDHVGGDDAIEVVARWNGASLWVGVADGSAVRPIVRELSHTELRGRGMRMVARIAHRWGAYDYRAGKRVWFELISRTHG